MWSYLGSGRWSRPTVISWFPWRGLSEWQSLKSSRTLCLSSNKSPPSFWSLLLSFASVLLSRHHFLYMDLSLAVPPLFPVIPYHILSVLSNSFTIFCNSHLLLYHCIDIHLLAGDSQDSSEEDKWYTFIYSGHVFLILVQSSLGQFDFTSNIELNLYSSITPMTSDEFYKNSNCIFDHFTISRSR